MFIFKGEETNYCDEIYLMTQVHSHQTKELVSVTLSEEWESTKSVQLFVLSGRHNLIDVAHICIN